MHPLDVNSETSLAGTSISLPSSPSTYIQILGLVSELNIKHFTATEIIAPIKGRRIQYIPAQLICNLTVPLLIWDACREDLDIKIRLTSTYRDEYQNQLAGGVKSSLHKEAAAIDGQPVNRKHMGKVIEWFQTANIQIILKRNNIYNKITRKDLGLGYYKTFIHCDARGIFGRHSPVVWKG